MSVTRDEIERMARLASLAVDDETLPQLTQQIDSILTYIAVLEEVVDPQDDSQPEGREFRPGPQVAPLRSDELGSVPLARPLGQFAPAMREGFFVVPKLEGMEP
jgi:aspartyl-tRNA(Asn)/glutamyl-tRNA(Gln) amidotransferase subunit C